MTKMGVRLIHACDLYSNKYGISAWWFQTSSKVSGQEFKEIHRDIGSLETVKAGADISTHIVVIAIKSVGIIQTVASDVVYGQENKYAPEKHQTGQG